MLHGGNCREIWRHFFMGGVFVLTPPSHSREMDFGKTEEPLPERSSSPAWFFSEDGTNKEDNFEGTTKLDANELKSPKLGLAPIFTSLLVSDAQLRQKNARMVIDGLRLSIEEDFEGSLLPLLHDLARLGHSSTCPWADVVAIFHEFNEEISQLYGIQVPLIPNTVSLYIDNGDIPYMDSSNGATPPLDGAGLLESIFLQKGQLTHVDRTLMMIPQYMAVFSALEDQLLVQENVLGLPLRQFLMVLAGCLHRCEYIVSYYSYRFLQVGGNPKWLQGYAHIPPHVQRLAQWSGILSSRPWMLTPAMVDVILNGPATAKTTQSQSQTKAKTAVSAMSGVDESGEAPAADLGGIDNDQDDESSTSALRWTIPQLVSATLILSHAHALSILCQGVGMQVEAECAERMPPLDTSAMASSFGGSSSSQYSSAAAAAIGMNEHEREREREKEGGITADDGDSDNTARVLQLLRRGDLNPNLTAGSTEEKAALFASADVGMDGLPASSPSEAATSSAIAAAAGGGGGGSGGSPEKRGSTRSLDPYPTAYHVSILGGVSQPTTITHPTFSNGPLSPSKDPAYLCGPHRWPQMDFSLRHHSLIVLHEWNWPLHCYAMLARYVPTVVEALDSVFSTTQTMTDRHFNGEEVDTSDFRVSVWNYVHRILGLQHDDYNYELVNQLLVREFKSVLKKAVFVPESLRRSDFAHIGLSFSTHEKVHVLALVMEAKRQGAILHAFRAIMNYQTTIDG
jgi:hypothetical protein